MSRGRLLVIDDDPSLLLVLADLLGRRGFQVSAAATAMEGLAALEAGEHDAVLTDLSLPGLDGLELCRRVVETRPDVPVIVMTAFGSLDAAIRAIRVGAWDFVPKPFETDVLLVALDRAVKHRLLQLDLLRLREAVAARGGDQEILGESAPMRRLFDLLDRVAGLDVSVLVTGESGSGKELIARALHRRGPRAKGPFVAVNCAAVPAALLESELFGHTRGAFTDAREARSGLFLQADEGTLFLDEVAELPAELQPKLLRALQERVVRPVGGDRELPFNARLVCATSRDLEEDVASGRFREDLYYRIHVVHIESPPLRVRGGDVLQLAQRFLERSAARLGRAVRGITPPAAERLLTYDWPGNVRELQNCMERAVALTRYSQITVDDLPEKVQAWRPGRMALCEGDPDDLVSLEELERRYIRRVLASVGGNRTRAAQVLGVDRKTLYRHLLRDDPSGLDGGR